MRKVTFGINISIDGYCDHTSFRPNEELYEYFINEMKDVDLIVYGRKMYELMFPYWDDVLTDNTSTKEEVDFARTLTAIDRVVFSCTLDSLPDGTKIYKGNLEDEIRLLKQQPGKNISIDSLSLLAQLAPLGLIDEFHFVVHPGIVGHGTRLLDNVDLHGNGNLQLVESRPFKTGGCVALHYAKVV